MVTVWKLAIILTVCSLLLPIVGVIAFVLELSETYRQKEILTSYQTACALYSLPPMLNLFGLFWVDPTKSRFPLSTAFLRISFIVASLAPVLFPLLLVMIGEFSLLLDFSSFWYGHAAPGLFVFLFQALGIALLALILAISQFLSWRDRKHMGIAA
jgi:hypothetical protein